MLRFLQQVRMPLWLLAPLAHRTTLVPSLHQRNPAMTSEHARQGAAGGCLTHRVDSQLQKLRQLTSGHFRQDSELVPARLGKPGL